CDSTGIESGKGITVAVALPEYRFPTQARLRALERQKLEEYPVVVDRNTPLGVVISDAERRLRPAAPRKRCALRLS
ncbi:MAG: hypothetical protein QOK44_2986, partial [Betaproteobacteria bacterium]|nr:hypothetical protein [Betaproteobacteria bacterium]